MLSDARKERGMTQLDLAIKLGVHPATVSEWERGLSLPQPRFRKELARIFGCHPFDLFRDGESWG